MTLPLVFPALFVSKTSDYKTDIRFDAYDENRNALSYTGSSAGVYHPPCRLFSKLRAFSKADDSEKHFAHWSISQARQYGGIVEHPLSSLLVKEYNVKGFNVFDDFGGIWLKINQSDFGFYTLKPTALYVVGLSSLRQLPPSPILVPFSKRNFSHLSPRQRSHTTECLRTFFYDILLQINGSQL